MGVGGKPARKPLHRADVLPYAVTMRYTDDTATDTPRDISRLIVPEAARALGISPEAVRNRLSRGTLDSTKENGTVYVLLEADRVRSTAGTPNDTPRSTADISGDTPDAHTAAATAALVAAKDETISLLRSQLEAEREANRENRRIIAGLVQRVPELEAARNGHETATAGPHGEENTARLQTAPRRAHSPALGGVGGSAKPTIVARETHRPARARPLRFPRKPDRFHLLRNGAAGALLFLPRRLEGREVLSEAKLQDTGVGSGGHAGGPDDGGGHGLHPTGAIASPLLAIAFVKSGGNAPPPDDCIPCQPA